jgi:hypothetical protein
MKRAPMIAAALIAAGLALEAASLASFSPGTFVAFVMVGAPLTVLGCGYFAVRAITVRWGGE